MGLFKFLKKREKKSITLNQIHDWLDEYAEKAEITTTTIVYSRETRNNIQKIKEHLTILEKAELQNEKVYNDRAKSMLQGNKKAYIQKVTKLISELKIPGTYKELQPILEETSEKLDEFAQDTQRNYFVLKEFVEEKARPISEAIQNIDKAVTKARNDIEKTNIQKINQINEKLDKLSHTKMEINSINKEIEEIDSRIEGHNRLIQDTEAKITKTKGTASYRALEDAEQENKKAKTKLTKTKSQIKDIFSEIKPALKKYANKTKDKQIMSYLDNPITTLENDENLEIKTKLKEIEKNIEKLGLKADKAKRITQQLKKTSDIQKMQLQLQETTKTEELTKSRIKNNHAGLEIKEYEKRIQITKESIEELEKEKQKKLDVLERYNPKVTKQEIRDLVNELDPWTQLSI